MEHIKRMAIHLKDNLILHKFIFIYNNGDMTRFGDFIRIKFMTILHWCHNKTVEWEANIKEDYELSKLIDVLE